MLNTYEDMALEGKRVFLRADLNIPLLGETIAIDHKLYAILPTIDYIQESGGKIVLGTHIGRPEANTLEKRLSTKILLPWFREKGYQIIHNENLEATNFDAPITLLENLRFFSGEKEQSKKFAQKLASLADVYINDAFGSIHRKDTSIALLPNEFEKENKAIGVLIEKELKILGELKTNTHAPFVLVLGGNKAGDKIPIIQNFFKLPEEHRPNAIIIGGAMAYTFLKAQGAEVGKSLIENESVPIARTILQEAHTQNVKIILPKDSLIALDRLDGETKMLPHDQFPPNGIGVDIGQSTLDTFSKKIEEAHTVFVNGTMGIYSNPNFSNGTKVVLKAVSKSHAFSVVGGGDAVAAAYKFKLENKFSFLSTGGGATLKFLSISPGNEIDSLPGLNVLK